MGDTRDAPAIEVAVQNGGPIRFIEVEDKLDENAFFFDAFEQLG